MIVAIAGASGLTGSTILNLLLSDNAFTQVIAVGRGSLGIPHPKLREVLLPNLADLPSRKDELRADAYFCCLGTTMKKAGSQEAFRKVDHDAVLAFGRIAESHEARAFLVISSTGAHRSSPIFYNRTKGETERDLQALSLTSLTIFRPSLLIGNRRESRTLEKLIIGASRLFAPLLPGGIRRSLMTEVETLASCMVRSAKNPSPGATVIEARDIAP